VNKFQGNVSMQAESFKLLRTLDTSKLSAFADFIYLAKLVFWRLWMISKAL